MTDDFFPPRRDSKGSTRRPTKPRPKNPPPPKPVQIVRTYTHLSLQDVGDSPHTRLRVVKWAGDGGR